MTREAIAAQLRADTYALLKRCDAHIVVGMTIGADGGVSECSSVMDDGQTAFMMHRLTEAGRAAIAAINAGGPLPLTRWYEPIQRLPLEREPCWIVTTMDGVQLGRWYFAKETPGLVGWFRVVTRQGHAESYDVRSDEAGSSVTLWTEAYPPLR